MNFLEQLAIDGANFVWGTPLLILLLGGGMFFMVYSRFLPFKFFGHAINVLRGKYDDPGEEGEISHFHALSGHLAATVGMGNISGVAVAIATGGPGALFWMWVTAWVGMATKFTSCTLAIKFRRIDEHGEVHGGPMHYIEQGMGKNFKWLAILFALFTALASFGIGNMFQINNMVVAINGLIWGNESQVLVSVRWIVGLATAFIVALVTLGGIKRIAKVASILVPFMCLFYIAAGLIILIKNIDLIVPGVQLILTQAFHAPESVAGGLLGGVIRSGVARGLFSNEAGLGSAAMAHGAARTNEPVREGLVAMLGPFIDTMIVCSVTALVIICTGAYETVTVKGQLTSAAFEMGLPGSGWIVSVGIILFAFTTLIAWSYYGDRAVDYLFGSRAVGGYRMIYVGFVLLGALRPLDDVINFCDALNGLMAVPNLIALVVLAPVVIKITKEYFQRLKAKSF